jgi:O-antigen ligase
VTEPPAARASDATHSRDTAQSNDAGQPREPRERWLPRLRSVHSLRGFRTIALLAFWLSLLFYPDAPSAHGVLAALAIAAAGLSVWLFMLAGTSVGASEPAAGSRTTAAVGANPAAAAAAAIPGAAAADAAGVAGVVAWLVRATWPYLAWLGFLTISWIAHFDDASTQEYLRQLCFLATVLAVGEGARGNTVRWVAAVIIGLALIVVQILGPHSVIDALGRPLHYRSIQQWSGYPEIGLLASIGSVASLALALADRRWRVRVAGLLFAAGFTAATVYLLSRFSLITIAVTGAWLAIIAALALRSRLAMTLLAAGAIAAGGLVVMRVDFSTRLRAVFVDRTAAVEIRSEGWRVARSMMGDHPLLGVGPGHFRAESVHYANPGDVLPHAYNVVLHEGAEVGYLGLAAYLAIWARVLWRTLRATGRSAERVAALATHGMLVAFFVRSQSEHFLANLDASFRVLLLLAFLFGLAESLGRARAGSGAGADADAGVRLRY